MISSLIVPLNLPGLVEMCRILFCAFSNAQKCTEWK